MTAQADAVREELRIIASLQAAMLPHLRFWRTRANAAQITGMVQPVQDFGQALDQLYDVVFQELERRRIAISQPGPYDAGRGITGLNNLHDQLTNVRDQQIAGMIVGNEADPYCRRFVQDFDNLRTVVAASRDNLADRALEIAKEQEQRRLATLSRGIRNFLQAPPPPNADPQILADYENFLREILNEINDRRRVLLTRQQPGGPAVAPYSIAEGIQFFTMLQSRMNQKDAQHNAQKRAAEIRLNDPTITPVQRNEATAEIGAIDYIRNNVHDPVMNNLADAQREFVQIEPAVSRVLADRQQAQQAQQQQPAQSLGSRILDRFRAAARDISENRWAYIGGAVAGGVTKFVITKAAFAAAAALACNPAGLLFLGGVAVVAGVGGGIASRFIQSRISGTALENNWIRRAAWRGAVGGAFGAAVADLAIGTYSHSCGSHTPDPIGAPGPDVAPKPAPPAPVTSEPLPPILTGAGLREEILKHINNGEFDHFPGQIKDRLVSALGEAGHENWRLVTARLGDAGYYDFNGRGGAVFDEATRKLGANLFGLAGRVADTFDLHNPMSESVRKSVSWLGTLAKFKSSLTPSA